MTCREEKYAQKIHKQIAKAWSIAEIPSRASCANGVIVNAIH